MHKLHRTAATAPDVGRQGLGPVTDRHVLQVVEPLPLDRQHGGDRAPGQAVGVGVFLDDAFTGVFRGFRGSSSDSFGIRRLPSASYWPFRQPAWPAPEQARHLQPLGPKQQRSRHMHAPVVLLRCGKP
jgi:hypothetical protein